MLEILELYVSGFWTWLGLTVALWVIAGGLRTILNILNNR